MFSPSRKLIGVCPFVALAVIVVSGWFSDAVARPAQSADGSAAVGSASSEAKVVEIPGSFKNPAAAKSNSASKSSHLVPRRLQNSEIAVSNISVDDNKLASPRRTNIAASKSRTIKIPVSLLEAGRLHEFNATAYCLKGRTASGHKVRQGVIAADPSVLPLGTVVHLQAGEYSGVYTVLDTGGRIKGHLIDVYVPTRREALTFGRRQVKLKVIGNVTPIPAESTEAEAGNQF